MAITLGQAIVLTVFGIRPAEEKTNGPNDQEKIKIAREYFMRVDQGRPDILEQFRQW
jgi:hypothetical protein